MTVPKKLTALTDVSFRTTHREGYQSKLLIYFTRRAADVISEAFFIAMIRDRHDELAAMDLSMTAVALTS